MKTTLKLIFLSVLILCMAGCATPVSQENDVAESNPEIVLPEATATPYIIYVTATAEPTIEPTEVQEMARAADLSISNDLLKGKVVYSKFISQEPVDMQIFVMNLADGVEKQITSSGINSQPMWSPDGTKILYTSMSEETQYDIFVMDEDGGNVHSLVSTKGVDANGVWSPDGKMVAYNSDVDGNAEIYTINVETNEINQITNDNAGYHGAPSWSPDGKKIVYVYGDGVQQGTNLFVYDFESGTSAEIDVEKFYLDDLPVWTPDGQHVIFQRMNGEFARLVKYDLDQKQESLLTENLFADENMENRVEKSAHGNFISFAEHGKFYVMNMDQLFVYPLGVDALDLHYYPQ